MDALEKYINEDVARALTVKASSKSIINYHAYSTFKDQMKKLKPRLTEQ